MDTYTGMARRSAARELLSLEKLYGSRGALSEADQARWTDLASVLFNAAGFNNRRRSSRLPCAAAAKCRLGYNDFACQISEVSHLGLSVVGETSQSIAEGMEGRLYDIELAGKHLDLVLTCQTIGVSQSGPSQWRFGFILLQSSHDPFFRLLYYPIYLQHLERLASPS